MANLVNLQKISLKNHPDIKEDLREIKIYDDRFQVIFKA